VNQQIGREQRTAIHFKPLPFHAIISLSKTFTEHIMNAVIGGLAALLYLLAGGWLALRLARASGGVVWPKGGPLALGWGAVILHAMILSQTVFEPAGLNLGFFNALSFTGWLIDVVLLAATMVRPVENRR
jgi:ABC-type uncharacterized transport system permease subunit